MASFLLDNPDLQYYLEQGGFDWDPLVRLTERGQNGREGFASTADALAFYKETAALVGELTADDIAPFAAEIDRQGVRFAGGEVTFGPRLESVFRQIGELGLHGLVLPRELGGLNAPMVLYYIVGELLARADASLMSHFGFHGGIATAMLVLSQAEGTTELDPATGRVLRTRWDGPIREIVSGRAWGSMDITEPDAGSDMAALRACSWPPPTGTSPTAAAPAWRRSTASRRSWATTARPPWPSPSTARPPSWSAARATASATCWRS
jgi:3-(methylthio)propanoyl-CoA dehydrogenase